MAAIPVAMGGSTVGPTVALGLIGAVAMDIILGAVIATLVASQAIRVTAAMARTSAALL